jgi:hypothetical protein
MLVEVPNSLQKIFIMVTTVTITMVTTVKVNTITFVTMVTGFQKLG